MYILSSVSRQLTIEIETMKYNESLKNKPAQHTICWKELFETCFTQSQDPKGKYN